MRLKNQIAVITGGNSGIGKGIATKFVAEGARVIIFGRNQKTLDETQKVLGDQVIAIQGDVAQIEDLKNLYKTVAGTFEKIDIVVANAGVAERIHTEKVEVNDFDFMVNTNLRGLFFTVQFALPYLRRGASIILIGSAAAHITLKKHSIYSATKAAVIKLAQNFSYDLADQLIRVNSISPGYIRTPIFDERLKRDPVYLSKREAIIPLHRIGTPEDVAHAALFFASEESSYITGVDLKVDGGITASFSEP